MTSQIHSYFVMSQNRRFIVNRHHLRQVVHLTESMAAQIIIWFFLEVQPSGRHNPSSFIAPTAFKHLRYHQAGLPRGKTASHTQGGSIDRIHCRSNHYMVLPLTPFAALRSERRGMGSAFHQLCPRYSGTLTPTAPTAIRLWEIFTFTFFTL